MPCSAECSLSTPWEKGSAEQGRASVRIAPVLDRSCGADRREDSAGTVSCMRRDQLLLGMTIIYIVTGWLHFFLQNFQLDFDCFSFLFFSFNCFSRAFTSSCKRVSLFFNSSNSLFTIKTYCFLQ